MLRVIICYINNLVSPATSCKFEVVKIVDRCQKVKSPNIKGNHLTLLDSLRFFFSKFDHKVVKIVERCH